MKKYKATVKIYYEVEGENFTDAYDEAYWLFKEDCILPDFSIDIEEIDEEKN